MINSISLKGLEKQYGPGGFSINIESLEFHNRQIHVIVGPNGSGKSALLNILALLESPDKGTIRLNGEQICSVNGRRRALQRKIGFVRQSPYLFNMDVFENVALGLRMRKYRHNEIISRVNAILTALKIEHIKNRNVGSLSGGEYQKAAIARVLVLEPEVILMDEPTANIDRESVLSIEETVRNIRRKYNSIVIMTTHSLDQAFRMSHDIISLSDGRLIEERISYAGI